MVDKKVLVLPSDEAGPDIIAAAERVMEAVAPRIDIIHGETGLSAYERSCEVLPPEIEDVVSDAILCGHVNISATEKRDPVLAVLQHTNMYAEVAEFYPLVRKPGHRNLDITIISSNTKVNQQANKFESLEGVASCSLARTTPPSL